LQNLVERLRDQAEKVPKRAGILHVRLRVALLGVNEVGELQRIANEEDGRVVANQVPDAFFRVELERKAAGIPGGIREPRFAGDGGESGEDGGSLSDFAEEGCLAKISHIPGGKSTAAIYLRINGAFQHSKIMTFKCTDFKN